MFPPTADKDPVSAICCFCGRSWDLYLPSLVTTALWIPHQCTAFIGMTVLHNLCSNANVSPAQRVWDTSLVTASAWMWNPDLLYGGFMGRWCVLTARILFVRFLARISSRCWCWSATGQAPDWPTAEPPHIPPLSFLGLARRHCFCPLSKINKSMCQVGCSQETMTHF